MAEEARHAETLGFSTLWRSGNLPMLEVAIRATTSIPVATGHHPVLCGPASDVIATYRLLGDHPGRFIVGLGGAPGRHPLATMNNYLDTLDAAAYRPGHEFWPRSVPRCWHSPATGPVVLIRIW